MKQDLKNFTSKKLSSILDIPAEVMLELSEDAPFLYRKVRIPKNDKEFRQLEIPHQILKNFQRRLLHRVFDKFPIHPKIFGGPKSSTKKAVASHIKKPVVITMDIKNFFPSVKKHYINDAFHAFGINKDLSTILTRLVTFHNHLPQGAPTSPCIGRMVLNPFAFELNKMMKRIHPNATFSIYVDDITLSGPEGIKRIIPTICKVLGRHGFNIKKEKTQIMYRNNEQVSLNIRLNERIEATKKYLAEIEELEKHLAPWDPRLLSRKAYVKYLSKPIY